MPNDKIAIFEDEILSLEGFDHSGGNYILDVIKGREIGRFMYGSLPIEISYGD